MDPRVTLQVDADLAPHEINAAYGWVEWPQRESWRLEAISHSCAWITARNADGSLLGIARVMDDGGLHASLWDVIVRPDRRRQGIGRALVIAALDRCRDRSLVVLVSTPAATEFFEAMGFGQESHGHRAMYLRPRAGRQSHS